MPGDFSNQDGGQSFMTQFLDYAKEVDLAGLDLPVAESVFKIEGPSCERVLFSDT